MIKRLLLAAASVAVLSMPLAAQADTFGKYGDVSVVNSGPVSDPIVFQLTSAVTPGYAGIYLTPSSPLLLNQITTLSLDYQMTAGSFGGGAPRFSIADSTNNATNEAYIYFGTPMGGGSFTDPNAGSFANTGNYANLASGDLRVAVNGFDGINTPNSFITWAQFVAEAGTTSVGAVYVDLDGGFAGTQRMLADNFTVNGSVFDATAPVPEPATWAMMLVGFGGLGAMMRRRRTQAAAVVA
ncbi:MAG: PEPxxWA-CTERM sorting domain-containing protein [Caulobacterales bacterium]|jgi:hypothetical protein